VHPVGSYCAEISRCAVNKTLSLWLFSCSGRRRRRQDFNSDIYKCFMERSVNVFHYSWSYDSLQIFLQ